jgi:hypothetical protein
MMTYLLLRLLSHWRDLAGPDVYFRRQDVRRDLRTAAARATPDRRPETDVDDDTRVDGLIRLGVLESYRGAIRLSAGIVPLEPGDFGDGDMPPPPPTSVSRPADGDDDGAGAGLGEVLAHPLLFALDDRDFDALLDDCLDAPEDPR